jgi:hypothetical protein
VPGLLVKLRALYLRHAAVDGEVDARDVTAVVRSEKQRHIGDFLAVPVTKNQSLGDLGKGGLLQCWERRIFRCWQGLGARWQKPAACRLKIATMLLIAIGLGEGSAEASGQWRMSAARQWPQRLMATRRLRIQKP